jgi:beta-lactamase regulating signal transducer with metallopeptidase domain
MSTATITSWLLTYLIHSTVLLGAAWLFTRYLGDRRLALQETLLRTALIGGLLTATLQVGFGIEPVGGALAVADFSQPEFVADSGSFDTGVIASNFALSPSPTDPRQAFASWPMALLSLWVLGSMLALLVLGRSIFDLRRLLKTRRFRPTGRLLDQLAAAMGLLRSVRLSTSPAIAVPFATGIKRPEICCPERVSDLAFEHQKSLFAHELAHLVRRDPAWQLLYRLGEAILFLQPLNRLVRRRLEEIAEHLTDERAVACTGDRLGLARCLVVVAHWGISDAPGVPATAFASGPRLDRRVHHLISGAVGQHRKAWWTAPLLAVLVVGSVALLPAIAPSSVHADYSPTGSDALPTEVWSTSTDEPEAPSAPAPPANPLSSELAPPVAPVPEAAPAPDVVPLSPAKPRPVSAPSPEIEPEPATAPDANAEPEPPTPPAVPEPPTKTTKPAEREHARTRDEARAREAEARSFTEQAREQARQFSEQLSRLTDAERENLRNAAREQSRLAAERLRLTEAEREEMRRRIEELHTQSRELARQSTECSRLTDTEREKLREEARELRKQAEVEAREHSGQAAERLRFTDAEREEMHRRVAELYAEARELARKSVREGREQARRLAEQAEAERQQKEEQRRREQPE